MLEIPTQNSVKFKADNSQRISTLPPQMQRPMQIQQMPDMYIPKQQNENSSTWQKAGIIGTCVLAASFLMSAIIAIKQHKPHVTALQAQAKASKAQEDYFASMIKKEAPEIKNFFEDLTKAESVDDLVLSSELKNLINTIKEGIENPGLVIERGGDNISSILLYGPPGTGKTTIAKAIAKLFPEAKFATLDVTKMKDKYVGETEKNINAIIDAICKEADDMLAKYEKELGDLIGHDLVKSGDEKAINVAIEKAKAEGKEIPVCGKVFAFADEIDSVMMVDTGSGAKMSNDMLNEFKKGFTEKLGKRKNVITIGATNLNINAEKAALDGKKLDGPMLDRFDMKVLVDNPTAEQIADMISTRYNTRALVAKELKDKNSKELKAFSEFLAEKERNTSFRTLKGFFRIAGNQFERNSDGTIKRDAEVGIETLFNIIKNSKDNYNATDSELSQLAKKLGIAA